MGRLRPSRDRESLPQSPRRASRRSDQEGAARWKGSLYNNIGWTYHDIGDYEQAMELFERGVEFRREQGKAEPLRIALWTVAHTTRMLDGPQQALEQLRAIENDFPEVDAPYVAEELGECLLAFEKYGEAQPSFQKAWQGLKDDPWLKKSEPARLERLERPGMGD